MNGVTVNTAWPNGREINSFRPQGRAATGEAAETVEVANVGALRVRAVRLSGGRTLLTRQL